MGKAKLFLAVALVALATLVLGPTDVPSGAGQTSQSTVWAIGNDGVWRSDDDGANWQLKRADACDRASILGSLAVVNGSLAYVTGCDGQVWRSGDGGNTWQQDSTEDVGGAYPGQMEANSAGVVLSTAGFFGSQLWRRDPTNGSWSVVFQGTAEEDFGAVSIRDNVAYVAANYLASGVHRNRAYKSTDSGLTWSLLVDEEVTPPQQFSWSPYDALVGVDNDTLYVADILYGLWIVRGSSLEGPYPLRPEPMAPDATALALRRQGGLYVGGWTCTPTPWPVRGFLYNTFFDLTSQINPGDCLLDYAYSVAEGDAGAFFVDNDKFLQSLGQNLYRSTDGGATWTTVNPPGEDHVSVVATAPVSRAGPAVMVIEGWESSCDGPVQTLVQNLREEFGPSWVDCYDYDFRKGVKVPASSLGSRIRELRERLGLGRPREGAPCGAQPGRSRGPLLHAVLPHRCRWAYRQCQYARRAQRRRLARQVREGAVCSSRRRRQVLWTHTWAYRRRSL